MPYYKTSYNSKISIICNKVIETMLKVFIYIFKRYIELINVLDSHHWLQVTHNNFFLRNNVSYIKNHKCNITMAHLESLYVKFACQLPLQKISRPPTCQHSLKWHTKNMVGWVVTQSNTLCFKGTNFWVPFQKKKWHLTIILTLRSS